MQIKNTLERYGIVAKLFHWVMALLVVCLLCIGLYMTQESLGDARYKFYGWHKEFGILVLMLVVLRMAWRVRSYIPSLPDTMPSWQKWAAHITHWALYFFMVAMPLTGWIMSSAGGHEISFFGLFNLPALIEPNKSLSHFMAELHEYIAYGLIATIILHVLAALKHHFIDKDTILKRML